MVVSSLNPYDVVIKKYKHAETNVHRLGTLGARLLFEVDAVEMQFHFDLQLKKFDRIVFNFPHAGFYGKLSSRAVIMRHKYLVRGFFSNSSQMLKENGEMHLTHKTTYPFNWWVIVEFASCYFLTLDECVKFNHADYPRYNNKRGDWRRSDEPFPLGDCSTYKFKLSRQ